MTNPNDPGSVPNIVPKKIKVVVKNPTATSAGAMNGKGGGGGQIQQQQQQQNNVTSNTNNVNEVRNPSQVRNAIVVNKTNTDWGNDGGEKVVLDWMTFGNNYFHYEVNSIKVGYKKKYEFATDIAFDIEKLRLPSRSPIEIMEKILQMKNKWMQAYQYLMKNSDKLSTGSLADVSQAPLDATMRKELVRICTNFFQLTPVMTNVFHAKSKDVAAALHDPSDKLSTALVPKYNMKPSSDSTEGKAEEPFGSPASSIPKESSIQAPRGTAMGAQSGAVNNNNNNHNTPQQLLQSQREQQQIINQGYQQRFNMRTPNSAHPYYPHYTNQYHPSHPAAVAAQMRKPNDNTSPPGVPRVSLNHQQLAPAGRASTVIPPKAMHTAPKQPQTQQNKTETGKQNTTGSTSTTSSSSGVSGTQTVPSNAHHAKAQVSRQQQQKPAYQVKPYVRVTQSQDSSPVSSPDALPPNLKRQRMDAATTAGDVEKRTSSPVPSNSVNKFTFEQRREIEIAHRKLDLEERRLELERKSMEQEHSFKQLMNKLNAKKLMKEMGMSEEEMERELKSL